MATLDLTPKEIKLVRDGLVMLRDYKYRRFYDSTNPEGETAQGHKALAEELDQLRYKILGGTY
jgi:hypothetical protein